MNEYKIELTSPIDRENLVVEIWLGENLLAELNTENGFLELEIYPIDQKIIKVEYEKFIVALNIARNKLTLNK